MARARLARFLWNKSPRQMNTALRFVVRIAYRDIPVYRRLLGREHDRLESFHGVRDLAKLPVATRDALFLDGPLADRINQRVSLAKCREVVTSGTQGMPVTVHMSRTEDWFRKLLLVRAWGQVTRLRFPLTVLDLGSRLDPGAGVTKGWHGGVHLIRIPLVLRDEEAIDALSGHRRPIVSGYPSSLVWFAERLGPRVSRLHPQMVATRGEILHKDVRRSLENAFGCPVFDFYNSEEIGNIAWQCPMNEDRMHVNSDACVVEVVDEEGRPLPQGKQGRILVTNLYNLTMPLIRYDLQDRGVVLSIHAHRCACGSRNPTIGLVEGRNDDFLQLSDGSRVSPRLLATRFDYEVEASRVPEYQGPMHRGYQIVQDALDHLTVRVVPVARIGLPFEARVIDGFISLDAHLRCTVTAVESLKGPESGKFRKVIRTFGDEVA